MTTLFLLFLLPFFVLFSLTVQADVSYGSKLENATHSFISFSGELNNFLFKKTMHDTLTPLEWKKIKANDDLEANFWRLKRLT